MDGGEVGRLVVVGLREVAVPARVERPRVQVARLGRPGAAVVRHGQDDLRCGGLGKKCANGVGQGIARPMEGRDGARDRGRGGPEVVAHDDDRVRATRGGGGVPQCQGG